MVDYKRNSDVQTDPSAVTVSTSFNKCGDSVILFCNSEDFMKDLLVQVLGAITCEKYKHAASLQLIHSKICSFIIENAGKYGTGENMSKNEFILCLKCIKSIAPECDKEITLSCIQAIYSNDAVEEDKEDIMFFITEILRSIMNESIITETVFETAEYTIFDICSDNGVFDDITLSNAEFLLSFLRFSKGPKIDDSKRIMELLEAHQNFMPNQTNYFLLACGMCVYIITNYHACNEDEISDFFDVDFIYWCVSNGIKYLEDNMPIEVNGIIQKHIFEMFAAFVKDRTLEKSDEKLINIKNMLLSNLEKNAYFYPSLKLIEIFLKNIDKREILSELVRPLAKMNFSCFKNEEKAVFIKIVTICFDKQSLYEYLFPTPEAFASQHNILCDCASMLPPDLFYLFAEKFHIFLIDTKIYEQYPEIINTFKDIFDEVFSDDLESEVFHKIVDLYSDIADIADSDSDW